MQEQADIDFIFAMGTWAGQDLANDENHIPTIVASTSNPIAVKIIASAEDSGWDHVHAVVDPDRYERQMRLFHDMDGFQKLGVVYENFLRKAEHSRPLTMWKKLPGNGVLK